MASKKQKNTALLRPLEIVRGPKPRKKPRHPRFSSIRLLTACGHGQQPHTCIPLCGGPRSGDGVPCLCDCACMSPAGCMHASCCERRMALVGCLQRPEACNQVRLWQARACTHACPCTGPALRTTAHPVLLQAQGGSRMQGVYACALGSVCTEAHVCV